MDPISSLTATAADENHGRTTASLPGRLGRWNGRWVKQAAFPYLLAGGAYLFVSLIIWLHVWTGHPTSMTTCGCGDPSSAIWYTAWPAYAISHLQNPLYSTVVGYPTGVNLIFASYGIVLSPITWLFGPVAAINVGLTLSPVLSALAMFGLVRRWTSWMPAPFFAGLFYGFSPFVLVNLSSVHVDFGMVAILPLVVICVEALLTDRCRRPVVTGILLGFLITLQFFVGLEVLLETIIEVAIGIVLVVVYAALQNKIALRRIARPAAIGFIAAAITTIILLTYPTWFAVAGPAHFSGSVHPILKLSNFGASARNFFIPAPPLTQGSYSSAFFHVVGGYQGPALSQQFFGIGVFVVGLSGLIIWRRDRLLWLFGILSLISLRLGTSSGSLLTAVPILRNIEPLHFVLLAYLAIAVVLGLVVDRTRTTVCQAWDQVSVRATSNTLRRWQKPLSRWTAVCAALVVAAVAIVQPAAYLAKDIPMTIEPVILPTWFRTIGPKLSGHPVVLALPAPFSVTTPGLTWQDKHGVDYPLDLSAGGKESAWTWQALSGQRFSIVGPGGLGGGVQHRAGENHGQNLITEITFTYGSEPNITPTDIAAVHRALSEWGVTTVVLPDQPGLPAYDQVASVTGMAALIAAATGAQPVHVADAWVWRHVGDDLPTSFLDAAQYARCTAGLPSHGVVAVDRTTACVLATPGR